MVPTDGGSTRHAAMIVADKTTETRMTPTERALDFDLRKLDAAFYADPYPVYDALRTREPIKAMPDGSLFLTRYRDVQAVYRDPKTFSSDKTVEFGPKYGVHAPLFAHHTTSLVFNDPPSHTRVRKLIAGALTSRAIAAMEPGLVSLIDGLLDQAAARGEIDLIDDFASAIPVEVIGKLLDVPPDERAPFRYWSLARIRNAPPCWWSPRIAACAVPTTPIYCVVPKNFSRYCARRASPRCSMWSAGRR